MKRASRDFHQSQAGEKEEVKVRLKHQTLLQEYLELQKEFVSKKKKLQITKQKKDILLAEIRFLRRRHKYLLKTQSSKPGLDSDFVHPPNSDLERKMPRNKRNQSPSGSELRNQYPVLVSNPNMIHEEEKEAEEKRVLSREEILRKMFKAKKPSKSYVIDDKSESKKKISWQDPSTLKRIQAQLNIYRKSCSSIEEITA